MARRIWECPRREIWRRVDASLKAVGDDGVSSPVPQQAFRRTEAAGGDRRGYGDEAAVYYFG